MSLTSRPIQSPGLWRGGCGPPSLGQPGSALTLRRPQVCPGLANTRPPWGLSSGASALSWCKGQKSPLPSGWGCLVSSPGKEALGPQAAAFTLTLCWDPDLDSHSLEVPQNCLWPMRGISLQVLVLRLGLRGRCQEVLVLESKTFLSLHNGLWCHLSDLK